MARMANAPEPDHPRGTLAILLIYGVLFVLGWLALFFGAFLPRGAG
jgi:amino acid transporter